MPLIAALGSQIKISEDKKKEGKIMNYDVIAIACEQLSYRDKLRLAQLLIQTARKEEENANPEKRNVSKSSVKIATVQNDNGKNVDTIEYVTERLLKLKPTKRKSLENSINAMFQFQGGITEQDVEVIISKLQKNKVLTIDGSKISYLKS